MHNVLSKYPKEDKIRLVLDNLKVHTSLETRKYLASVPGRFEFVFTPTHGSWLNLVESFFSKLTRQLLPIKDWALAINQFAILFDGRVPVFN